jgi:hypothetical protein
MVPNHLIGGGFGGGESTVSFAPSDRQQVDDP